VEELVTHHVQDINHVYVTRTQTNKALFALLKQCRKKKIPCNVVTAAKITQIAATSRHQGVAAVCSPHSYTTEDAFLADLGTLTHTPCVLVPAAIEDPRNLGSILRCAWAFGVDGVLLERSGSVGINATVAKASAGASQHLRIVRPYTLQNTIAALAASGFLVCGVDANGTKPVHTIDVTRPVCLVLGGEHRGIPPYLSKLCAETAAIPMQRAFDSLNVSVAAGIVLYERYRKITTSS
jgi:23S rRNA (guanosine2251-2'-O)-methyltransferase